MDPPIAFIGLVRASQCIAKGLPLDALWDDFGVLIYSLIISKGFLMDALWDDFGFLTYSLRISNGFPFGFPMDSLWVPYKLL